MIETIATEEHIACIDCDFIHRKIPIKEGSQVKCTRCGSVLYRNPKNSLDRTLAFALAGLILFIISNTFPFLALKIQGQMQQTILMSGIFELYDQGLQWLAVLVFLTIILLPMLELLGVTYLLLSLKFNRVPWKFQKVLSIMHTIHHWGMVDVFMLGILVSMIKLAKMAEVVIGPAFYSFMFLLFAVSATARSFDPEIVWRMAKKFTSVTPVTPSGNALKTVGCHSCRLLCHVTPNHGKKDTLCPRCFTPLHSRKTNSISRTWALVIAASILYIPANLLPITIVSSFAGIQADTIMSGVIYFVKTGMIPIALIIFIASVVVPLLKLIFLTFLLVSLKYRFANKLRERTTLYRLTEAVGRWSMVDVYVITILVALVKLGGLATIEAGPGALFFGGVVVITMFAAMSFDPRLIWDFAERSQDKITPPN